MDRLHLKVYFFNGKNEFSEIRRLNLAPTFGFADLCAQVRKMTEWEFTLKYEDPEGDHVALSSEADWEECQHLGPYSSGAKPLKVYVRRSKESKEKEKQERKEQKMKEKEERKDEKRKAKEERKKLQSSTCSSSSSSSSTEPCCPEFSSTKPRDAFTRDSSSSGTESEHPERVGTFYTSDKAPLPEEARLKDLLVKVQHIVQGFLPPTWPKSGFDPSLLPEWLKSSLTLKKRTHPIVGEMADLDVDIAGLEASLSKRGLTLLEEGKPADALQFFQNALEVSLSCNHPYNMACCLALMGLTDDALIRLNQAVALGYKNIRHLKADDDLRSLHSDPRFLQLVKVLEEGLDTPTAPEPLALEEETTSVSTPAPAAEEQPKQEEQKQKEEEEKEDAGSEDSFEVVTGGTSSGSEPAPLTAEDPAQVEVTPAVEVRVEVQPATIVAQPVMPQPQESVESVPQQDDAPTPEPDRFVRQRQRLAEMGFVDSEQVNKVLEECNGAMQAVVERLLRS